MYFNFKLYYHCKVSGLHQHISMNKKWTPQQCPCTFLYILSRIFCKKYKLSKNILETNNGV